MNATDENRVVPQTYIIAQNPAVLARLMMENQKRGINPAAYTTPASVFNTLAVGIDASKSNQSLKTTKLPAAELLKLDPVADSEKHKVKLPTNSISSQNLNPSSTSSSVASSFDLSLMPANLHHMHIKAQVSGFSNEHLPLKNNFILCAPPTESDFHVNQLQMDHKSVNQTPRSSGYSLYGSLERHQPPMEKSMHSKGGSLERHQSLMAAQNIIFHKQVSSDRSRSMERKTHLHTYRQQMKTSLECESLPEEIYDFGGVGLKTCVSVKQKSDGISMLHASPISSNQIAQDYISPRQEIGSYTEFPLQEVDEIRCEWNQQWTPVPFHPLQDDISEGAACNPLNTDATNQV